MITVKAFSVLSWNVQHFGATDKEHRKPKKPIKPIMQLIADQKADVVAIYEVVGSVVFEEATALFPDHNWFITEGPQSQEILVGARKSLPSFFTQKVAFKSGNALLRPGALLTVSVGSERYPLLFLHLKSLTKPRGFGLRDDQTEKAIDLRKPLDKAVGPDKRANYIFLGDLNTMGMNLTFSKKDVSGQEEITRLQDRCRRQDLVVLDKAGPTWWPGSSSSLQSSNLDHVVAAEHLRFKQFAGFPVDLRGWPELNTDIRKDAWRKKFSDHAILYFEVQKV